ncbi:MAG: hypothetical protein E7097_05660 [Bacteroides sp.]|nr:hypothetical protein [Bacteroides sp.]
MTDTIYVCLKDSLLSGNFVGILNCSEKDDFLWSLSLNDFLTLLLSCAGFFIVLCQFRHEMKLSRKQSKEASDKDIKVKEREWYLSVIVQPQIDSINEFYKELIEKVSNDVENIRDNIYLSEMDILVCQSKIIADNQEYIYSFFDHLETLVQPFDEKLSMSIVDEAMDLEDRTSKLIEYYLKNKDESLGDIRRLLLLNKVNVISLLYDKSKEI